MGGPRKRKFVYTTIIEKKTPVVQLVESYEEDVVKEPTLDVPVVKEKIDWGTPIIEEIPLPTQEIKKAKEVKQEVVIEEVLEPYELFKGVYSNNDQTKAINGILDFLESDEKECLLIGKGGTGKTTIIKKVLDITNADFCGIAISHKAKKVLFDSIYGKGYLSDEDDEDRITTVASALAIRLNETTGEFKADEDIRKVKGIPLEKYELIIVDECSMISKELYQEIINLSDANSKIIWMGDPHQLPPVGESGESLTFKVPVRFELIQRMRQGEQSPIVKLSDVVADNIFSKSVYTRVLTDELVNSCDKDVFIYNHRRDCVDSLVKDVKHMIKTENPSYVKAVTFNNHEHDNVESVKSINRNIRAKVFGTTERYVPGEIIMCSDTWSRLIKVKKKMVETGIINSENYIIKKVTISETTTNILYRDTEGKKQVYQKTFKIYLLDLKGEDGRFVDQIPVIHEDSEEFLLQDLKYFVSCKLFFPYYRIKAYFASIQYGYAITCHRSQGSTYDKVYVFESNILGPTAGRDDKTKNKSLYVAMSRPKKELHLIRGI